MSSWIIIFFRNDVTDSVLSLSGTVKSTALRHYISFFDFSNLRLDAAFRKLCSKLYLKAETQQVDRILDQFSQRYWDCNPGCLFGSSSEYRRPYIVLFQGFDVLRLTDIVHQVSYSLLLLNTDLHVADLTNRMSRNQFVKNTMSAIQNYLNPETASVFDAPITRKSSIDTVDDGASVLRGRTMDSANGAGGSTHLKRSESLTSWNSVLRETPQITSPAPSASQQSTSGGSTGPSQTPNNESQSSFNNSIGPSVSVSERRSSTTIGGKAWENEVESLLKVSCLIPQKSDLEPGLISLTGYVQCDQNQSDRSSSEQFPHVHELLQSRLVERDSEEQESSPDSTR